MMNMAMPLGSTKFVCNQVATGRFGFSWPGVDDPNFACPRGFRKVMGSWRHSCVLEADVKADPQLERVQLHHNCSPAKNQIGYKWCSVEIPKF